MNADLERASYEARRDSLTGVANRLLWNEALSSASASVESPASIVLLDCRGLKSLNDVHGHHVGDELLCRVAGVLNTSIRTGDLVSRLGGDEFALLLYEADETVTHTILERIEAALEVQLKAGQPAIHLATGTSTSRDGDLEAAQRRADVELLDAKRVFRESSHLPPSA
jgi:two-component system CheB/CheR fusion protein